MLQIIIYRPITNRGLRIAPTNNHSAIVKNSTVRVRNAEQGNTFKKLCIALWLKWLIGYIFKMFVITVSNDLKQFHACGMITRRLVRMFLFEIKRQKIKIFTALAYSLSVGRWSRVINNRLPFIRVK